MSLADNIAVTLDEVKEHVNQTQDLDDNLLERKIAAAQAHLENMLGYKLDLQFPEAGETEYPDTVPADIREAICQLSAWWYAQREAALVGTHAQTIPLGIEDIVSSHRTYTFGYV